MYKISSRKAKARKVQKMLKLLLKGIVLLALIVLIGCQTPIRSDNTAKQILVNEIPTLPSIPSWPNVSWFYEDGKYSLNESDVDKVLNYLENEMPLYEFEINRFEEDVLIIINGLLAI